MADLFEIAGRIHSTSQEGVATVASEILDETQNKKQSEVNTDVARHENEIHGTGGIDSRVTDLEAMEQIVIDGGDAQIATGADFTNPDVTKRAKVPTVGAIVDGLNDGVYDVSKRNPTAGPNSDGKFTLDYILDNANTLIPTGWRHGGMSISFVHTSDNKYVQYRLMSATFSTTPSDWQGVDDEPTAGSENLVKSGGVAGKSDSVFANSLKEISNVFNINFFDKNSLENITNYYLTPSGEPAYNEIYTISHYIPFTKEISKLTYTFSNSEYLHTPNVAACLYDEDLRIVAVVTYDTVSTVVWQEGVSYVRFTLDSRFLSTAKITIGDFEERCDYVPFGEVSYKKINGSNIESSSLSGDSLIDESVDGSKLKDYSIEAEKLSSGIYSIHLERTSSVTTSKFIELLIRSGVVFRIKVSPVTDSPNRVIISVDNSGTNIWLFDSSQSIYQYDEWYEYTKDFDIEYISVNFYGETANGIKLVLEVDSDIAIRSHNIVDSSITANKIADGSVGSSKLSEVVNSNLDLVDNSLYKENVQSNNLLNISDSDVSLLHYISSKYGTISENNSYNTTGYIPVVPGKKYYVGSNGVATEARTYLFYTSNKDSITTSFGANSSVLEAPEGSAYLRLSIGIGVWAKGQLNVDSLKSYQEYFEPYTYYGIKEGVKVPTKKRLFDGFKSSGEVTAGNSLTISPIHISKNTRIVANIQGNIESVEVGYARNTLYGEWVVITPTELIVKYGSSGTIASTYTHGLTLGVRTKIIIDKTFTQNSTSSAFIKLIDDYGNVYSQILSWIVSPGTVFVYNGNISASINVEVSFMPADITKKIWIFGDSYLTFSDTARWMYYPINWGYGSFLIDARGGENATESLNDLKKLLSSGYSPNYIVWCLGMNNGSDSNDEVNPTWLSVSQELQSICDDSNIELVFATIPTVPSLPHARLNEWVRDSGYRYIDFAAAVEDENSDTWRGWGTSNALLSSDEVHPTEHGAVELALQALTDFPEMTIENS